MRTRFTCLLGVIAVSVGAVAGIAEASGMPPFNRAAGETPSGQPVPRFVSLKFAKINGRAGPDRSYPVRWEYRRKGLPVRVVAETDEWRRIQDPEGATCWVHRRMIDGRRTAIIRPSREMRLAMRTKPDSTSRIAAWASDGVIVDITDERPGWREIKSGRFKGWVPTSEIWGGDNKAMQ